MYNKKFQKLLKKNQPNSGFTLTELLAGLFMSVFVTGALGFGLYQIMSATAREKAKTDVRNEASRAVEFISDELRRASAIEPDIPSGSSFTAAAGQTVVLALEIPGQSDSIIYYLEDSSGNWQGPQVLYRWGPPLDANGNYTDNNWQNEALIDGIDDTTVANSSGICDTGDSLTPVTPKGFYACVNGTNTAAQIFLTGGIDTDNIEGNDTNYTAQTKTVARAKNPTVNDAEDDALDAIIFKSLGADYTCHPNDFSDPNDDTTWTMRMDFDTAPYDSSTENTTKWIHDSSRQPQPVAIDREDPMDLTIYSAPISSSGCLSKGNGGATIANDVGGLGTTESFTIKYQKTVSGRDDAPDFYKTFNGNTTDNPNDSDNYNNPNVDPNGKVIVLKNGSVLKPVDSLTSIDTTSKVAPAPLYPGYDPDGDGPAKPNQSLGEFLADKDNFPGDDNAPYATANSDGSYTIEGLKDNQRLVAFEIGQKDNGLSKDDNDDGKGSPGFDLQDNIILMSHDVFGKPH